MKTDMTLVARVLEDILPESAYFIVLVGEQQVSPNDENCGFATDLSPEDAIKMMEEMTASMKEQKP